VNLLSDVTIGNLFLSNIAAYKFVLGVTVAELEGVKNT
jgi:hypothetical protein